MTAYKAHGAALSLWSDRSPELLLSGPAGTGKSRACLEKIHACCLHWPGSRWLILRKTRESLTESALVTYETKVLPRDSPIAAGCQRRMRQSYHYPNGSEIIVGGLDKPSKIMSTEYDGAYVQEAIEVYETDWESVTTRLRNGVMPFQQIIGDTNPDSPTHWIKQREKTGRLKLIECRHEDNPVLFRDGQWTEAGRHYVHDVLDSLTGVLRDRYRHGKWVQAEGVVYPAWDRNVHLIKPFLIPDTWRKIRSIDFGYTNPFVCQWWAIDPDGRMYLYREIYHSKRTIKVHAEQIRIKSVDEKIAYSIADHAASERASLRENRIRTIAAKKEIEIGIQAVEERLKIAGDGKPRLFVMEGCLVERDQSIFEAKRPGCTADEFECYIRPPAIAGKAVKEDPIDDNNHGMDAMRYAVMALDRQKPPDDPEDPEEKAETMKSVQDQANQRHLMSQGWR